MFFKSAVHPENWKKNKLYLHLANFPAVVSSVTYPNFLVSPTPFGRPNPSAAFTVPKDVNRLEISSAVIEDVRPEIISLLVTGVSMVR